MKHSPAVFAALTLALAHPANAELVGVVVGVPDGDTLAVQLDDDVLNVNLRGIDAPEVGQPYGALARDSLATLCDAKKIVLDELGIDRSKEVFGEAECAGVDVGEEQVRRGLAWARVRKPESPLDELQAKARAQHKGLWSDASPVPPWEWSAIFTR